MRRLGDVAFFRLFDRLIGSSNPDQKLERFVVDGVTWMRERHNFGGNAYRFSLEVFIVSCPSPRGWTMTAIKEYWWKPDHRLARSSQWIVMAAGSKADATAWFRRQEGRLG